MNFKEKNISNPKGLIRDEAGRLHKARPQEADLTKELKKIAGQLGVLFNGMQERINDLPPVALFTDKKTRTTFGVEPDQNIKIRLDETRERFSLYIKQTT